MYNYLISNGSKPICDSRDDDDDDDDDDDEEEEEEEEEDATTLCGDLNWSSQLKFATGATIQYRITMACSLRKGTKGKQGEVAPCTPVGIGLGNN